MHGSGDKALILPGDRHLAMFVNYLVLHGVSDRAGLVSIEETLVHLEYGGLRREIFIHNPINIETIFIFYFPLFHFISLYLAPFHFCHRKWNLHFAACRLLSKLPVSKKVL